MVAGLAMGGMVVVEGAFVVEGVVVGAMVDVAVDAEATGGDPAAPERAEGELGDDPHDPAMKASVLTPTNSPTVFVCPSPLLVIGPLSNGPIETP